MNKLLSFLCLCSFSAIAGTISPGGGTIAGGGGSGGGGGGGNVYSNTATAFTGLWITNSAGSTASLYIGGNTTSYLIQGTIPGLNLAGALINNGYISLANGINIATGDTINGSGGALSLGVGGEGNTNVQLTASGLNLLAGTFSGNGSGLTNTPSTLAAPVPTNSQPTVLASAILIANGGRAMIWTNSGHYSDSLFAVQLVIGGTTLAMTNLFSATWGTPVTPGYQPYILIGNENDTNSTQATSGPELHAPFSLITTNGFQVWSGFTGPAINTTNYYVFTRLISQ